MDHKQELESIRAELSALSPLTDPQDPISPERLYWLASEIEDRLGGIARLAAKLRRNALARYRDHQPTLFDDEEEPPNA